MLCIISPSKDMDFKTVSKIGGVNSPRLWNKSLELLKVMKSKKVKDLCSLMDISEKLALENVTRYQSMEDTCTSSNSKAAIFAFTGDVYRGLDPNTLNETEILHCQNHTRILSGFYGLLRPLDLIQAYRLEMGINLKVGRTKNLYQFWGEYITNLLNEDILESQSKGLLNLASQEYYQAIVQKKIEVPIIDVQFRELRNGKLSFLSYNAKRARGLVVRYVTQGKINNLEDIKNFDLEKYTFDSKLSSEKEWYFVR